jgi:ABC-type sugar transport system ATPase subunit
MAQPFLQLKGISKKFAGIPALNSIDLCVDRGEIVGLVGANGAGKSTLMNILGGIVQRDAGSIFLENEKIEVTNPISAMKNGIAFVHQEMTMLDSLSVLDNCMLTSYPNIGGFIKTGVARRKCAEVLKRLDCELPLNEKIRNVSPGDQQLVEIARVLIQDPHIVIFDEPTSSLSQNEKERLFTIIKNLQKDNVAIIYITHLLDELPGLCNKVVILRNGSLISQGPMQEFSRERIVRDLTGEDILSVKKETVSTGKGEPVLVVSNFNKAGAFKDISFQLNKGEILGIWGLMGAGRTEIIRALVGLDPIDSGTLEVCMDGKKRKITPGEFSDQIGLITEDRRNEGLFQAMSVKKNISVASLRALLTRVGPFISLSRENQVVQNLIEKLNIKISSVDQEVRTLSGGNQQKVVIGRWLAREPQIFIMDEPIKGIDVSAKAEIKKLILDLSRQGRSVIFITSEIDELVGFCDRYIVLCHGHKTAEFPSVVSSKQLMDAATTVNYQGDQLIEAKI